MRRPILTILLALCLGFKAKSQVVLGYFPFNYGEVQLTSSQENLFFADLRVETNSFISNLNTELGGAINLQRTEQYNLYVGAGLRFNPFYAYASVSGYYLPVGVRWRPIRALSKLGLVFELSPLFYERLGEGLVLRSKLGLSYAF